MADGIKPEYLEIIKRIQEEKPVEVTRATLPVIPGTDVGLLPTTTIYEQLAQRASIQSNWELAFKGLGRFLIKSLAGTGEGIGYMASALPALATWDSSVMIENSLSKMFRELGEEAVKNLPVYHSPKYYEGAKDLGEVLSRMTSMEYIADDLMDVFASTVSIWTPGLLVGKLGLGKAVTKGLFKTSAKKFNKNMYKALAGMPVPEYPHLDKIAKRFNMANMYITSIGIESAMEANEVRNRLFEEREMGLNNATDEEIEDLVKDTFYRNMALLSLTNIVDVMALSRSLPVMRTALEQVRRNGYKAITDPKIKDILKGAGIAMTVGSITEGFLEEGPQYAFGEYASQRAQGKIRDDWFRGITEQYFKGLADPKGQEAVLLGSLIGGIFGFVGGGTGVYSERKRAQMLQNLYSSLNTDFLKTPSDFYKKDENGNTILEIDEDKVIDAAKRISDDQVTLAQFVASALQNNRAKYEVLKDISLARMVSKAVLSEDGFDVVIDKLNWLKEEKKKDENYIPDPSIESATDVISTDDRIRGIEEEHSKFVDKAKYFYNLHRFMSDKVNDFDLSFIKDKNNRDMARDYLVSHLYGLGVLSKSNSEVSKKYEIAIKNVEKELEDKGALGDLLSLVQKYIASKVNSEKNERTKSISQETKDKAKEFQRSIIKDIEDYYKEYKKSVNWALGKKGITMPDDITTLDPLNFELVGNDILNRKRLQDLWNSHVETKFNTNIVNEKLMNLLEDPNKRREFIEGVLKAKEEVKKTYEETLKKKKGTGVPPPEEETREEEEEWVPGEEEVKKEVPLGKGEAKEEAPFGEEKKKEEKKEKPTSWKNAAITRDFWNRIYVRKKDYEMVANVLKDAENDKDFAQKLKIFIKKNHEDLAPDIDANGIVKSVPIKDSVFFKRRLGKDGEWKTAASNISLFHGHYTAWIEYNDQFIGYISLPDLVGKNNEKIIGNIRKVEPKDLGEPEGKKEPRLKIITKDGRTPTTSIDDFVDDINIRTGFLGLPVGNKEALDYFYERKNEIKSLFRNILHDNDYKDIIGITAANIKEKYGFEFSPALADLAYFERGEGREETTIGNSELNSDHYKGKYYLIKRTFNAREGVYELEALSKDENAKKIVEYLANNYRFARGYYIIAVEREGGSDIVIRDGEDIKNYTLIYTKPAKANDELINRYIEKIKELAGVLVGSNYTSEQLEGYENEINSMINIAYPAKGKYGDLEGGVALRIKVDDKDLTSLYLEAYEFYPRNSDSKGYVIKRIPLDLQDIKDNLNKEKLMEALSSVVKEIGNDLRDRELQIDENFLRKSPFDPELNIKRDLVLSVEKRIFNRNIKFYKRDVESAKDIKEEEEVLENEEKNNEEWAQEAYLNIIKRSEEISEEEISWLSGILDKDSGDIEKAASKTQKESRDRERPIMYSTGEYSEKDRIDLLKAEEWINNHLPDFIRVEDINKLFDNLIDKNITWGTFVDNIIYLNSNAPIGTEYHEAFHAVFELLLTDEQIKTYLSIAEREKGGVGNSEILKFRNRHTRYKNLSKEKIKELILEEYLADKFRKWKLDRTIKINGLIKVLFLKIYDFFRWITGQLEELDLLFYNIDRGKYINAPIQSNIFTKNEEWLNTPMMSALRTSTHDGRPTYLSRELSNILIHTVAAKAAKNFSPDENSFDDYLKIVIKEEASKYSLETLKANMDIKIEDMKKEDLKKFVRTLEQAAEVYAILGTEKFENGERNEYYDEFVDEVHKAIKHYDKIVDSAYWDNDEEGEYDEDNDVYSKRLYGDADTIAEIPTFRNMTSSDVRRYIAFTLYETTNPITGKVDELAVNPVNVYNALINAHTNRTSNEIDDIMNNLLAYAEDNPELSAFVNKFIKDVTIVDDEGKYHLKRDSIVAQKIYYSLLNAIDLIILPYVRVDLSSGMKKFAYDSNALSRVREVMDLWYTKYSDKVIDNIDDNLKVIQDAFNSLSNIQKALENDPRGVISDENIKNGIKNDLKILEEYIGIDLSYKFIKASALKLLEERGEDMTDLEKMFLHGLPKDFTYLHQNIDDIIKYFKVEDNIKKNPFTDPIPGDVDTHVYNIFRNWALSDSYVNEKRGLITFINVSGSPVSEAQRPTYLHRFMTDILKKREPGLYDELKRNNEGNLFFSEGIEKIHPFMKILRVDGIRYSSNKGVPFKKFDTKDLMLFTINAFYQYAFKKGQGITFSAIPIFLSPTSHALDMLLVKVYDNVYSTRKDKEGNIIGSVSDIGVNNIYTYVFLPEYNAYKGGKSRDLFTFRTWEDTNAQLYSDILESEEITPDLEGRIKSAIRGTLEYEINRYIAGVKRYIIEGSAGKGALKYNNSNVFGKKLTLEEAISMLYVNHFLWSSSLNSILQGNRSNAFESKDSAGKYISYVKRIQSLNLLGSSIRSLGNDYYNIAVIKEPEIPNPFKEGDTIKIADSQGWMTTRGLRKALLGLGRLKADVDMVISDMEKGVDEYEIEQMIFDRGFPATGVMKLGYNFTDTFLKTSIMVLPKRLTSMRVKGKWVPKPGYEWIHNLREKMEKEDIDFVFTESASKKMSDVAENIEDLGKVMKKVNGRYFVNITENNPKTEITVPLQHKFIVPAGSKYLKEYDEALSNVMRSSFEVFKKFLQGKDGKVKREDIVDALRKLTTDISSDRFLSELLTYHDGKIVNVNFPLVYEKLVSMYLSTISKYGTHIKRPGRNLVKATVGHSLKVLGVLDDNGEFTDQVIPYRGYEEVPEKYVVWNEGEEKPKKNANQKYIRPRPLRYNMKDKDGNAYMEVITTIKLKDQIGAGFGHSSFEGFAVRIPTQGMNFTGKIKVVDTLPAYMGNTIFMPHEAIYFASEDFDFDIKYVLEKYYYKYKREYREYGKDDNMKEYETIRYHAENNDLFRYYVLNRLMEKKETDPKGVYERNLRRLKSGDVVFFKEYMDFFKEYIEELGLDKELNPAVEWNKYMDIVYKIYNEKEQQVYKASPGEMTEKAAERIKGKLGSYLPDGLMFQLSNWIYNKGGSGEVGSVVNTALNYLHLSKFGIKLRDPIKIGKEEYDSFDYDEKRIEGLSELISMVIDNTKNAGLVKTGMANEALGPAAALIAIGVPFNAVINLVNIPEVKKYVGNIIRDRDNRWNLRNSVIKRIGERLDEVKKESLTLDDLSKDKEELDNLDIVKQLKALDLYLKANDLFYTMARFSPWLTLSRTLGSDFYTIRKMMTNKSAFNTLYNTGKFIEDPYNKTLEEVINWIREKAGDIFIPETKGGRYVLRQIYQALPYFKQTNKDLMKDLEKDFIVYSTALAYYNKYMNKDYKYLFSRNLLIPGKENSIEALYKEAKDSFPRNYFLGTLSIVQKRGILMVNQNLSVRQDPTLQEALMESFEDLLRNDAGRRFAYGLLFYLLIRDGFSQKMGSPINGLPLLAFHGYNLAAEDTLQVLRNRQEEKYKELFGIKSERELAKGFAKAIAIFRDYNKTVNPTVRTKVGNVNVSGIEITEDTVSIDIAKMNTDDMSMIENMGFMMKEGMIVFPTAINYINKVYLLEEVDNVKITDEVFKKGFSAKYRLYGAPKASILSGLLGDISQEKLIFIEHNASDYPARTKENIDKADATIAIAIDFNTAGERLTYRYARDSNKKYIPINISENLNISNKFIDKIVQELNSVNAKSINIVGNGIYTLKKKYTQQQVDDFVYNFLKMVIESPNLKNEITSIRTGGQTGIDEAGAKAGAKLGIKTIVLAPKGWKFRDINEKDISSEAKFKERFKGITGETPAERHSKGISLDLTPVELTKKPIGSMIDETEGTGICSGTCGLIVSRLKKAGMPYGSARIDDKYANYHKVAITEIDGERFILDQPQLEFIGRKYPETPLYESAIVWRGTNLRFNRHLAELNELVFGEDIPITKFLTGKPFESEFGTIEPVFKDIKTKKEGEYTIGEATLISNPAVKVKWKIHEKDIYGERIDLKSYKEGEAVAVWTSNKFTPRLIKATKENLINDYELTEEQAERSLRAINNAQLEQRETQITDKEYRKGEVIGEFEKWEDKEESVKKILDFFKDKFNISYRIINSKDTPWKGHTISNEGLVEMNMDKVTLDTPFHEISHPFLMSLRKYNPELFDRLYDELTNAPEWKDIKNRAIEVVKRDYPEYSDNIDNFKEEVLATALGWSAAKKWSSLSERLKRVINAIVEWIKGLFNIATGLPVNTASINTNTKLGDIVKLIIDPSTKVDLADWQNFSYTNSELITPKIENETTPIEGKGEKESIIDVGSDTEKLKEEVFQKVIKNYNLQDYVKSVVDMINKHNDMNNAIIFTDENLISRIKEYNRELEKADIEPKLKRMLRIPENIYSIRRNKQNKIMSGLLDNVLYNVESTLNPSILKEDISYLKRLTAEYGNEAFEFKEGERLPVDTVFIRYLSNNIKGKTELSRNKPFSAPNISDYEKKVLIDFHKEYMNEIETYFRSKNQSVPKSISNERLLNKYKQWLEERYPILHYEAKEKNWYNTPGERIFSDKVAIRTQGKEIPISIGFLSYAGHLYLLEYKDKDGRRVVVPNKANTLGWYIYHPFKDNIPLFYEFQSDFIDLEPKRLNEMFGLKNRIITDIITESIEKTKGYSHDTIYNIIADSIYRVYSDIYEDFLPASLKYEYDIYNLEPGVDDSWIELYREVSNPFEVDSEQKADILKKAADKFLSLPSQMRNMDNFRNIILKHYDLYESGAILRNYSFPRDLDAVARRIKNSISYVPHKKSARKALIKKEKRIKFLTSALERGVYINNTNPDLLKAFNTLFKERIIKGIANRIAEEISPELSKVDINKRKEEIIDKLNNILSKIEEDYGFSDYVDQIIKLKNRQLKMFITHAIIYAKNLGKTKVYFPTADLISKVEEGDPWTLYITPEDKKVLKLRNEEGKLISELPTGSFYKALMSLKGADKEGVVKYVKPEGLKAHVLEVDISKLNVYGVERFQKASDTWGEQQPTSTEENMKNRPTPELSVTEKFKLAAKSLENVLVELRKFPARDRKIPIYLNRLKAINKHIQDITRNEIMEDAITEAFKFMLNRVESIFKNVKEAMEKDKKGTFLNSYDVNDLEYAAFALKSLKGRDLRNLLVDVLNRETTRGKELQELFNKQDDLLFEFDKILDMFAEKLSQKYKTSVEDIYHAVSDSPLRKTLFLSLNHSDVFIAKLAGLIIDRMKNDVSREVNEVERKIKEMKRKYTEKDFERILDENGHIINKYKDEYFVQYTEAKRKLFEGGSLMEYFRWVVKNHDFHLTGEAWKKTMEIWNRMVKEEQNSFGDIKEEWEKKEYENAKSMWEFGNPENLKRYLLKGGNFDSRYLMALNYISYTPKKEWENPKYEEIKDDELYNFVMDIITRSFNNFPQFVEQGPGMMNIFLRSQIVDIIKRRGIMFNGMPDNLLKSLKDVFFQTWSVYELGRNYTIDIPDERGEIRYLVSPPNLTRIFNENKDPWKLLTRLYYASTAYKHKRDTEPVLMLVKEILNKIEAGYVNKKEGKIVKPVSLPNVRSQLMYAIQAELYDKVYGFQNKKIPVEVREEYQQKLYEWSEKVKQGEDVPMPEPPAYFTLEKTIQKMISYTRLRGLAFNIPSMILNSFAGFHQNFIYAAKGKEFNDKDSFRALRQLMHSALTYWTGGFTSFERMGIRTKTGRKIVAAMREFGIAESMYEGQDLTKSRSMGKVMSFLFGGYEGGEYFIRGLTFLSILNGTKVKVLNKSTGKEETISLWDAYTEKNGSFVFNDSKYKMLSEDMDRFDSDKMSNFKVNVRNTVNRVHGDYSHALQYNKQIYTRVFMIFRRWLPELINERWGKEGRYARVVPLWSKALENVYTNSTGSALRKVFKVFSTQGAMLLKNNILAKMIGIGNVKSLEEKLRAMGVDEKSIEDFKANSRELEFMIYVIMLFSYVAYMAGDDDNNGLLWVPFLNMMWRARDESFMFVSPESFMHIMRDIVPLYKTFADMYETITSTTDFIINAEDYRISGKYDRKWDRVKTNIMELFPGLRGAIVTYRYSTKVLDPTKYEYTQRQNR